MKKLRIQLPDSPFIKNLESGNLMENFLISAVVSLLFVRLLLEILDYPTVGSDQLHIAHMLWGGLLMLVAVVILLNFLNREAKEVASVVAGLGFGLFIDELGKFITNDHNYFFEPTAAFIYVIFVIILLVVRAIDQLTTLSTRDYAVNALEIFKDVMVDDLDIQEKKRALTFLDQSDPKDPMVKSMRIILKQVAGHRLTKPNIFSRSKRMFREIYQDLIHLTWFSEIIIMFFVITTTVSFVNALMQFHSATSFLDTAHIFASLLTGFFVLAGVVTMRKKDRLVAYEFYKYATLVSIFLVQFFTFYREQFSALIDLVLNVSVYVALRYLISQEILSRSPHDSFLKRLHTALIKQ